MTVGLCDAALLDDVLADYFDMVSSRRNAECCVSVHVLNFFLTIIPKLVNHGDENMEGGAWKWDGKIW